MTTKNEFTNPERYQVLADRTKCDQSKAVEKIGINSPTSRSIGAEPNPNAIQLLHAVVGLAGEVGELATTLEKWIWYGQEFDRTNVKEELGDVFWYLAELHNAVGESMLETMQANIRKLQTRYPDKYDWEKCREENRNRVAEANAIDSVMRSVEEKQPTQTGQGWAEPAIAFKDTEPPKDGFEVARDIANSFIEGQNRDYALKTIDNLEKLYDDFTGDNL